LTWITLPVSYFGGNTYASQASHHPTSQHLFYRLKNQDHPQEIEAIHHFLCVTSIKLYIFREVSYEYLVVDSRNSCRVPDNLSMKSAAPLACAGCTIWRAIIVSEVKEGGWLAITGAGGGLGHLGI
jgi:hypothetical protein